MRQILIILTLTLLAFSGYAQRVADVQMLYIDDAGNRALSILKQAGINGNFVPSNQLTKDHIDPQYHKAFKTEGWVVTKAADGVITGKLVTNYRLSASENPKATYLMTFWPQPGGHYYSRTIVHVPIAAADTDLVDIIFKVNLTKK